MEGTMARPVARFRLTVLAGIVAAVAALGVGVRWAADDETARRPVPCCPAGNAGNAGGSGQVTAGKTFEACERGVAAACAALEERG
jgi:hypothetical protein